MSEDLNEMLQELAYKEIIEEFTFALATICSLESSGMLVIMEERAMDTFKELSPNRHEELNKIHDELMVAIRAVTKKTLALKEIIDSSKKDFTKNEF